MHSAIALLLHGCASTSASEISASEISAVQTVRTCQVAPSQKETIVFQPAIFRCELLVSGRVYIYTYINNNTDTICVLGCCCFTLAGGFLSLKHHVHPVIHQGTSPGWSQWLVRTHGFRPTVWATCFRRQWYPKKTHRKAMLDDNALGGFVWESLGVSLMKDYQRVYPCNFKPKNQQLWH